MVRLKENDNDLGDVVGTLRRAFDKVLEATLRHAFISVAAPAEKTEAARALDQFYRAAGNLRTSHEKAFNSRAQRAAGKLSLLDRLPSREQFPAMRDFSAAKAGLLSISSDIGNRIVRHAARQQGAPGPSRPRLPFPRP